MNKTTCWTLIAEAAGGDGAGREEFSRLYLPMVRAYLAARWRGRLGKEDVEDAVQEVFVECLREGGVLERVTDRRDAGFRAFLLGVVRNVALRMETRRAAHLDTPGSQSFHPDELEVDEESLSRVFDRAWATSLMREAGELQTRRARTAGSRERRRVELLRLRFQDDLPIRAVAQRWGVDAAYLHHEYATARSEFEDALRDVIAFHHPDSAEIRKRHFDELVALLKE